MSKLIELLILALLALTAYGKYISIDQQVSSFYISESIPSGFYELSWDLSVDNGEVVMYLVPDSSIPDYINNRAFMYYVDVNGTKFSVWKSQTKGYFTESFRVTLRNANILASVHLKGYIDFTTYVPPYPPYLSFPPYDVPYGLSAIPLAVIIAVSASAVVFISSMIVLVLYKTEKCCFQPKNLAYHQLDPMRSLDMQENPDV